MTPFLRQTFHTVPQNPRLKTRSKSENLKRNKATYYKIRLLQNYITAIKTERFHIPRRKVPYATHATSIAVNYSLRDA